MANIVKTKAPLKANKYIKQTGNGQKTIKLAATRNTKIKIKKS